ncbi:MAG: hypothetical protein RSC93_05170 [Erysipelotrichaceae bacterium]
MDYYETIINKVQQLMENLEFKEAYDILEEEMKMPYIPSNHEPLLIDLFNQCRCELQSKKPIQNLDINNLESLLNGSIDEQFAAVELLKTSNIRKHLDLVCEYLKNKPHFLVRSMLIELLSEQAIRDEMTIDYDGMDVTFTPCYIEAPMDSDGAIAAVNQIREWFEDDNPTFVQMCVETLVKEAYLKLPFNIDIDESIPFALAIVEYVFQAYGEREAFTEFVKAKELERNCGYDLLLWKHDI